MPTIQTEELLHIDEVASILKRSPAAVRNLIARERIPFRKIGGRIYCIRSELFNWISKEAPGVRPQQIK